MKYNAKFTKIEDGYYRAKINNVELWEVDELLVWAIKEREKLIEELQNKINKAVSYLKQPYRDNFDFSKTQLLEILGDKENE